MSLLGDSIPSGSLTGLVNLLPTSLKPGTLGLHVGPNQYKLG